MTNTIGAFEAKTQFSRLLARAKQGEEFVITHRGEPMAKLVPIKAGHDVEKAREAIAQMRDYARKHPIPDLTIDEIRSWINEGRR